jgi:hypothetical protein
MMRATALGCLMNSMCGAPEITAKRATDNMLGDQPQRFRSAKMALKPSWRALERPS